MAQSLQVMVVVQQPIFREGVIAILKQMVGCKIIGHPESASEALELARAKEPDVALLDTFFDSIDTLEIARQMRIYSPKTAVIMLSELEGEEWLFQAVKVGAAAYYTRNITPEDLVRAIQKVSKGEYLINRELEGAPDVDNNVITSSLVYSW